MKRCCRPSALTRKAAATQSVSVSHARRPRCIGASSCRTWCSVVLCGVGLITSDDHAGLEAARKAIFPGVPWQRCQFHLQLNAAQYVTRIEQRKEVAADLRAVFNAPSRAEADRLLAAVVKKYAENAPRLSRWLEENIPQGLTVFAFPVEHQRRLRTTNLSERVNR